MFDINFALSLTVSEITANLTFFKFSVNFKQIFFYFLFFLKFFKILIFFEIFEFFDNFSFDHLQVVWTPIFNRFAISYVSEIIANSSFLKFSEYFGNFEIFRKSLKLAWTENRIVTKNLYILWPSCISLYFCDSQIWYLFKRSFSPFPTLISGQ